MGALGGCFTLQAVWGHWDLDLVAPWIPVLPGLGLQRGSHLDLEQNVLLGAEGGGLYMHGPDLNQYQLMSLQVRMMRC